MTGETPFRTRGQAVPPAERSFRRRRAVRVLVLAEDRLLMFHDRDPGLPGSGWWVLPGGGVDPGETDAEAARREILEETGLQITTGQLEGPTAIRTVIHGYSDQVTIQEEAIFLLRVEAEFEADDSGFTEFERLSVQGHRWLSPDEEIEDAVWPVELQALVALAEDRSRWPVDLGTVEESVVPVELGYRRPGTSLEGQGP